VICACALGTASGLKLIPTASVAAASVVSVNFGLFIVIPFGRTNLLAGLSI
jgi:hypothetical protein